MGLSRNLVKFLRSLLLYLVMKLSSCEFKQLQPYDHTEKHLQPQQRMHRVAQPPMMRVLIFVSFGRRQIMLLHLVMKLNR
jgi:hypothetical protein